MSLDSQLILPLPGDISIQGAYTAHKGKFKDITGKLDFQRELGNVVVLEEDLTFLDICGEVVLHGDYRGRLSEITLAVYDPAKDEESYHKRVLRLELGTPGVCMKRHRMELTKNRVTAHYSKDASKASIRPVYWVKGIQLDKGAPTDTQILVRYRDLWSQLYFSQPSTHAHIAGDMDPSTLAIAMHGHLVNWLSELLTEMLDVPSVDHRLYRGSPGKLDRIKTIKKSMIPDKSVLKGRQVRKVLNEIVTVLSTWPYDVCWIRYKNNVEDLADSILWKSRKKRDRQIREIVETARKVSLSAYKKMFRPLVLSVLMRCLYYLNKPNDYVFKQIMDVQGYPNVRYDPDGSLYIGALGTDNRELAQIIGLKYLLTPCNELDVLNGYLTQHKCRDYVQSLDNTDSNEILNVLEYLWENSKFLDGKETAQVRKHAARMVTLAISTGDYYLSGDGKLLDLLEKGVLEIS